MKCFTLFYVTLFFGFVASTRRRQEQNFLVGYSRYPTFKHTVEDQQQQHLKEEKEVEAEKVQHRKEVTVGAEKVRHKREQEEGKEVEAEKVRHKKEEEKAVVEKVQQETRLKVPSRRRIINYSRPFTPEHLEHSATAYILKEYLEVEEEEKTGKDA